jgi:hypothetical protein
MSTHVENLIAIWRKRAEAHGWKPSRLCIAAGMSRAAWYFWEKKGVTPGALASASIEAVLSRLDHEAAERRKAL